MQKKSDNERVKFPRRGSILTNLAIYGKHLLKISHNFSMYL